MEEYTNDDWLYERGLLLESLKYSGIILKLGKAVGEQYCLQFDDGGYDAKYNRFDAAMAIPKIAEKATDDQLIPFLSNNAIGSYVFRGRFYTLRGGKLTLETEWPSIEQELVGLLSKHGENVPAVLEACLKVISGMGRRWKNYLHIEAVAKDLGASNFRTVLTDLELAGVIIRHKGDIEIPSELRPLVQAFLEDLRGGPQEQPEEPEDEQIELPEDLFDIVVGHERLKKLFAMSIKAPQPVHILLVGPPATAKSIFLMELERLPRSRYALGGTSSKAGVVDFIIEQRPRYLILDELEKMDMKDFAALLSLMAEGVVTRLKKGMTEKIKVKTWVFGAVNRDESLPLELKSRFLRQYLPEYSEQDYKRVVRAVLTRREHVDEKIAAEIAEKMISYSRDVRDAIKIARLHKADQLMTINEIVELAFNYQGAPLRQ